MTSRRLDWADRLFILAASLAALVILGLGAGLTFLSDEWAFIESRSLGDPTTWFQPHNEHWATLPILVYRALVEAVGLRSYMPYLAVLVGFHLIVAALVYVLARRSSGRWPALAVSLVVLFLGTGFENLYWAFQIGFVGALAAGLGAILAFDARDLSRRCAAVGTGLLIASLASTGIGLVCFVAVAIEIALDPRRRREIWLLSIPAATYVTWYVVLGGRGMEWHQGLYGLGGFDDLLPTIAAGFSAATASLVGMEPEMGWLVLALAVIASVVWAARRGRIRIAPRFMACLVAVATLYGLIAVSRSFAGPNIPYLTRYTYISAILLIVGLSAQVGRPFVDTPFTKRTWLLAGGMVLTLSLIWNVRVLIAARPMFADQAERTRAFVTVALERPLPASTDPDRSLDSVPAPNALARIVRTYGSPVGDDLVPWAVPAIRPEVLAEAHRVLEEGSERPLSDGTADDAP